MKNEPRLTHDEALARRAVCEALPDPSDVMRQLTALGRHHPETAALMTDAVRLIGRQQAFVCDTFRALQETRLIETLK